MVIKKLIKLLTEKAEEFGDDIQVFGKIPSGNAIDGGWNGLQYFEKTDPIEKRKKVGMPERWLEFVGKYPTGVTSSQY